MKKITLNETDLMKIVKRVLNEQEDRQFDEDEINFLYWIFERELKPPFKGEVHYSGWANYFNRDNEWIGVLDSDKSFAVRDPFWLNIKYKVCQVFQFSYDTWHWWYAIKPHLKSWMENQINLKLFRIYL